MLNDAILTELGLVRIIVDDIVIEHRGWRDVREDMCVWPDGGCSVCRANLKHEC